MRFWFKTRNRESVGPKLAETIDLLQSRGFVLKTVDRGTSSGGAFENATARRGNIEMGVLVRDRDKLGCPNYTCGEGYVGHEDVMWALGAEGAEHLVPGCGLEYVDRRGGNPFVAFRKDLEQFVFPALESSEPEFRDTLHRALVRLHERRGW